MNLPPRQAGALWPRYSVLAFLAIVSIFYQARVTLDVIEDWNRVESRASLPFRLEPGTRVVGALNAEAEAAGLGKSDEILAINGEEFRGYSILSRLDDPSARFTIRRPGQPAPLDLRLPLHRAGIPFTPIEAMLIDAVLSGIMPWICTLLGLWAVLVRPRDPQAWLLVALMLSFPHMFLADVNAWSTGWRHFGIFYHRFMGALMPVSMVLFGIYFAERLSLDRRLPWLKYVLIAVGIIGGAGAGWQSYLRAEDFLAIARYQPWLNRAGALYQPALFLSIGFFFFSLGTKFGVTRNPDVRRRLKLLMFGTQIAMTPMFLVLVYSFFSGRRGFGFVHPALLTAALVVTILFPLTITYVIVVHRALDLRVALRQGIQYALVSGGTRVFFIAMGAVVVAGSIRLALDPEVAQPRKYAIIALGIAAMFLIQRLRLRLAAWVDRRFFRQAYDAEHILSELSEDVRTIVDSDSLLRTVGEKISQTLFVPRIAFFLADGSGIVYRPSFALGYDGTPPAIFAGDAATVQQLRKHQAPAKIYLDDPDSWVWRSPEMTDQERQQLARLESQILLPLSVKEKLLGFLALGQKKSEEPYSGTDLRLLRSLAAQTGLALENSRLTAAVAHEAAQRERDNRELEIAREVQERLFPQTTPAVEGLDCCGGCRPALGVGGDYYDFLLLPDGRLGIVIGDVSGKGIAAALLMASLQASVRGQALHSSQTLAGIITSINSLIYGSSTSSRYATLFYGQLDPKSLALDYVNAGHNPPIVLRATGEVERLEVGGTVVGLLPQSPYQQARVQLHPGDLLVAFTDGVSEAENSAQQEWGEDRLIEAIRECAALSAAEIIPALIRRADSFAAGAPQHDDMTLVVVKVVNS